MAHTGGIKIKTQAFVESELNPHQLDQVTLQIYDIEVTNSNSNPKKYLSGYEVRLRTSILLRVYAV
jgi:hypothetical protein